jgi:hypothetical protein
MRVHHPCGSGDHASTTRRQKRSRSSLSHLRTALRRAFIAPVIAELV